MLYTNQGEFDIGNTCYQENNLHFVGCEPPLFSNVIQCIFYVHQHIVLKLTDCVCIKGNLLMLIHKLTLNAMGKYSFS